MAGASATSSSAISSRPSTDALSAAFAALKEAGATELIVDLRYNGGGLVDVAVHLSSLIGGTRTNGQIFAEFRHNDRNSRYNEALRFRETAGALSTLTSCGDHDAFVRVSKRARHQWFAALHTGDSDR